MYLIDLWRTTAYFVCISLYPYFSLFKVFYNVLSWVWLENVNLFLVLGVQFIKGSSCLCGFHIEERKQKKENPPALYDTTVLLLLGSKEGLTCYFFSWDFLYLSLNLCFTPSLDTSLIGAHVVYFYLFHQSHYQYFSICFLYLPVSPPVPWPLWGWGWEHSGFSIPPSLAQCMSNTEWKGLCKEMNWHMRCIICRLQVLHRLNTFVWNEVCDSDFFTGFLTLHGYIRVLKS